MSKRAQPRYDLDEVRPDLFLIGDPQVHPVIKTEGEISGKFFQMKSWRREGMAARLLERGFRVRTLDDRLADLPAPPPISPPGPALSRDISGEKQGYLSFDAETLSWQPAATTTEGEATVLSIPLGSVLRRRRGRGTSSYFRVFNEGGRAGLSPLDEDEALLQAYAQAAAKTMPRLQAQRVGGKFLLPRPTNMPPQYRAFIEALGEATPEGVLVGERGWSLARKAYGLLGLRAELARAGSKISEQRGSEQSAATKQPKPKRAKRPPPKQNKNKRTGGQES